MNARIQSVKFDADKKLIDFINAKLDKINHFEEKIIDADVILKLDKDHDNGNKVVTIKLNAPGEDMVAEKRSHSFEEAADGAFEALKSQIAKRKK